VTEDIQYSGALSVEDLNALLLAIRSLPGVVDAQGGVQDLQVTYDPARVSHQSIVEAIKARGYAVKE
jgi:allophanate hydrolase subunit 1